MAILLEAWSEIEVLNNASWLEPLPVAALLPQEGLAAAERRLRERREFKIARYGRFSTIRPIVSSRPA